MPAPTADYVILQFPSSLSAATGEATTLIYGRIYEPGVTEAAGANAMVIAQVGYGPAGSDPTTSSDWVWVDATFGTQVGNDDEYQATLTIPTAGTYSYTYRFAIDDGVNPVVFTYADVDGAGTSPGLSFDPSSLGTVTVTGEDAHFLALGDRIFFDANADGVYVSGQDSGIDGVSVSLFLDANGDNLADGAAIATAVTSGGGAYSFSGLAPDNYIIGIDASNFGTGGALEGLVSTSGSGDPDDDVDNDDNGVDASGGAVLSNSVTLGYGSETAADGTGGLNINDTLDFGFVQAPNAEPSGTDNSITLNEDGSHVFSASDFGFGDTDGNAFAGVVITTLPTDGRLLLDGAAVALGAFVSADDIAAGLLSFAPGANESGDDYASFTFQVRDDGGTDSGGEDTDQTPNTMMIDVTAVNDAPVVTIAPGLGVFGKSGGEDQVNATAGGATGPATAVLANGNYVVVWNDQSADGNGVGVKGLLYSADGNPIGNEFLINTATSGTQSSVTVTALSNGGFAVAWYDGSQGAGGAAGDSSGGAVKLQLFAADGSATGSEILVNTSVAGNQFNPQLTPGADGGVLVTWVDDAGGSFLGIKAQLIGADGSKIGSEIDVTPMTMQNDPDPVAVSLSDGGFVIVWTDTTTYGNYEVKAQLYTSEGAQVGGAFNVATATANDQVQAEVAALPTGGFVVTWTDLSQGVGGATGDTSGAAVKAQVFAADGSPVGSEILVNTATSGPQTNPVIQALPDGRFVVAWQDGIGDPNVKAQLFDADGTRIGDEILVNTNTTGQQADAKIIALADGGFVISWVDQIPAGPPDYQSNDELKAQVFTADGLKAGEEITVNASLAGDQNGQVMVPLPNGDFVIIWSDRNPDNGASDVQAQLFSPVTVQVDEQTSLSLKGAIDIADVDARTATVTATISVDYGILNIAEGSSGATIVSGNGTAAVVVSGTVAQINALLNTDASSSVTYTPDTDAPPASTVLTVSVDDGGNTGSGGAQIGSTTETILITAINDAPSGADDSVTTSEDDGHAFTEADFGFTDGDGNAFAGVVITTLPANGTLTLGGSAVAAGAFVSAVDIAAGNLVFTPDANEYASAYASFTFQVRDDGGTDGGGEDTDQTPNTITIDVTADPIEGTAGNDTLIGTGGDDVINGGEGDDTLEGGAGDDLLDGGDGVDTATYAGAASGVTVDLSTAGAQNTGGAGSDTLANVENLTGSGFGDTLTGDAGANLLSGLGGNDALHGGQGDDTLYGGDGDDLMDGGPGADTMAGGRGNDRYEINNAGDVIIEADGEGEDRLLTKVSYTLAPGASVEILGTTNQQATAAIDITGNEFGQRIYGNAGVNVLDGGGGDDLIKGGAGADTMIGGTGNDRFFVNDVNDVVAEAVGEGSDWVQTKVSYALAEGSSVETLSTTNASSIAAIDLSGNELKNAIHGNAGANVLDGGGGDDRLFGLEGADTLIGGAGTDALKGGAGNDRFVFNAESDSAVDAPDRILDFASGDLIDLAAIDANLGLADDQAFTLVGSAAFTGTAGELRYEQIGGNTYVEGDTDGDGVADFLIRIDGLHTLDTGDFLL